MQFSDVSIVVFIQLCVKTIQNAETLMGRIRPEYHSLPITERKLRLFCGRAASSHTQKQHGKFFHLLQAMFCYVFFMLLTDRSHKICAMRRLADERTHYVVGR